MDRNQELLPRSRWSSAMRRHRRVLTINCWSVSEPFEERMAIIRRGLASEAPDVVGFQEVIVRRDGFDQGALLLPDGEFFRVFGAAFRWTDDGTMLPHERDGRRARRARGCRRGRQGWTPCPQRPAAPAGPAPARAARWAPPLHSLLSWLRKNALRDDRSPRATGRAVTGPCSQAASRMPACLSVFR